MLSFPLDLHSPFQCLQHQRLLFLLVLQVHNLKQLLHEVHLNPPSQKTYLQQSMSSPGQAANVKNEVEIKNEPKKIVNIQSVLNNFISFLLADVYCMCNLYG